VTPAETACVCRCHLCANALIYSCMSKSFETLWGLCDDETIIPVFVYPKQIVCSLKITYLLPELFLIPIRALHSCWNNRSVTLACKSHRKIPQDVCFLLGNSPASKFYMPTFRNTLLPNWLKLFLSQTLSHMDTPTILKFSHYLHSCLWRWNR
jgi:hypothetical protein